MAAAKKPSAPAPAPAAADPVAALNALLERARKAETAGDPAGALAALDGAPPESRVFGTYHFARGSLLFRKGDLSAAAAALKEAVRLEPEIPEFKANLGAVLVETARRAPGGPGGEAGAGALAEAIAVLDAACGGGGRPKTCLAHNNLGMALQAAGRLDVALAAFDAAIEIDARDVSALYNRAATLHLLGREEDCLAALDATIAVDPKFEPAQRSRAGALKRLGR